MDLFFRLSLILVSFGVISVGIIFFSLDRQGDATEGEALSVAAFLARHWSDPLQPQGAVPSGFSELEASLAPQDCGACHPSQLQDWRGSKHAQAMGIGIRWQLPLLGQQEGNRCLRCHAPLAEQKALTARRLGWNNAPDSPPPDNVPEDLDLQGLVCAACHVRTQRFYGPPARLGADRQTEVHGGFDEHEAFAVSRFCAHCHQFPDDGPRVNGKLLEDTYAQWQAGPAAEQGTQCQDCHMPDRRHLWRGIHDPEMVRQALSVDLALVSDPQKRKHLEVTLWNLGAGHLLPTYTVPKLVVEVTLQQAGAVPRQLARELIGWYVETDLQTERYDTRIPPGESRVVVFSLEEQDLPADAELLVTLDIYPREHYERMFRQVLADPNLSDTSADAVKTALQEAEAARYRLWSQRLDLTTTEDTFSLR